MYYEQQEDFFKYDKVSDVVMQIAKNCVLKFNVSLSSVNKNGDRKIAYSEYEYRSFKCNKNLVTIKRDADFYLSIENMVAVPDVGKAFIQFRYLEMPKLLRAMEICYEWFTSMEYSSLFIKVNGRITLDASRPSYTIPNLPGSKYIKFDPCVVEYGPTKSDLYPGLMLELSNPHNRIGMDVDHFFAFKYVLDRFDMYQAYSNIIGMIYSRNPQPINRMSIGGEKRFNNSNETEIVEKTYGIPGRQIGGNISIKDLE